VPADLLFEIGSEEIPAKMLARALADLPAQLEARLAEARLEHHGVRALGTPRRIAVVVKQLADQQPSKVEQFVGPPVGAAFDASGKLTKAGEGFAKKHGVAEAALQKVEVAGKKGLYLATTVELVGNDTRVLLPQLLVDLAGAIAWPKSMRWGWGDTTFVRPVQWLVALFGGEVVPLSWAGQTAGRASRGHRFLANHAVDIATAGDYEHALREARVVVDPAVRRTEIESELARLARETHCKVRPDAALLDEVANLGEYPKGVCGAFDPAYLDVPEEVVVTAMRTHQRYFAMEDAAGKLAPRFATVMATIVKDAAVVARGNETVIAARLSDARFFWAEDLKRAGFDAWNAKLDGVVFQAKLGDKAKTIGAKVRRVVDIVHRLDGGDTAELAARYCKADLASHVVGEFPELQGVMGKHYARRFGLSAEVADVIEQHWWPKGQGGALPQTAAGFVVAIADRIDTLVGCFATGLAPTGNADPLGLRRAALGILEIETATGNAWSTAELIGIAADAYGDTLAVSAEARAQLAEFFRQRLRGLLVDRGVDASLADVALGAPSDNPYVVMHKATALATLSTAAKIAFKRIGNILDDARAKGFGAQSVPRPEAFVAAAERELHAAFGARRADIASALERHDYRAALTLLSEMGPVLAAFFDKGGVMVMDPDPALRENRLALLRAIYEPFAQIGDFRKLGAS
jgi:glycyl-tRNA synthetase beta chain